MENAQTERPALLTLADGVIYDFKEEHYQNRSGCDTCAYGSSYVQDFQIVTSKGDFKFNFEQMYDYKVSHDCLFKVILPNVEVIKEMTIERFLEWFEAKVDSISD